jgi:hypothetical protein
MAFASASIAETAAAAAASAATSAVNADVERASAGVENGNEIKNEQNKNENSVTKTKTNDKQEQEPLFSFLTGMQADLAARLPLYLDDWGKPDSIYTVANATIFAFVIQLIPALIFAELIAISTDKDLGTVEVLLSAGMIGS